MFTGLIQEVGILARFIQRGNYHLLTIDAEMSARVKAGDSIACDGACLTVTEVVSGSFTVEASQETKQRTILSDYSPGRGIHLEQALQIGARLDGHFVTGHIDDCGTIGTMKRVGDSTEIEIRFNRKYDPLVVEKGSIAINGISLTVNRCLSGLLSVNVIPHTIEKTTIREWCVGQKVNVEFDIVGKHILKIQQSVSSKSLTKEKLFESGW